MVVYISTRLTRLQIVAALPCLRPCLLLQVVSVDELGHGIRAFNTGMLGSWRMGLWLT